MKTQLKRVIATSATSVAFASAGLLLGTLPASATPTASLCDISTGLDSSYEWATDITLDSVSITPDFSTADYYDADSAGDSPIPISAGQTYTISMTVEADPVATGYDWQEDVEVWIDFNGDGTLDSAEVILYDGSDTSTWTSTSSGTVEATFSDTFLVPNVAIGGQQWGRALNYDPLTTDDPLVQSPACWDTSTLTVSGSATDFVVDITALAPNSYTVTFDGNGGTGSMASQSASAATSLTANSFARVGYTFTGWNTAADGTGTAYANSANYPFTASTTLFAQWQSTATPAALANTGISLDSLAIPGFTLISFGTVALALYRRRVIRK